MIQENDVEKVARFQAALNQLVERIAEDRYVLAVVLVGSLSAETIWRRESLWLWIIEADGVTRRLPSDGNDERIFRILVEDGINIHAEVIPRSRFKKMVEGASRTAFSCNFFAERQMVYTKDPSIQSWFKKANSLAIKDQERELLDVFDLDHPRSTPRAEATGNQGRLGPGGAGNPWGRAQRGSYGNHPPGPSMRT